MNDEEIPEVLDETNPEEILLDNLDPSLTTTIDYTQQLDTLIASNEVLLNRLEFSIVIAVILLTLAIYNTIRSWGSK